MDTILGLFSDVLVIVKDQNEPVRETAYEMSGDCRSDFSVQLLKYGNRNYFSKVILK